MHFVSINNFNKYKKAVFQRTMIEEISIPVDVRTKLLDLQLLIKFSEQIDHRNNWESVG